MILHNSCESYGIKHFLILVLWMCVPRLCYNLTLSDLKQFKKFRICVKAPQTNFTWISYLGICFSKIRWSTKTWPCLDQQYFLVAKLPYCICLSVLLSVCIARLDLFFIIIFINFIVICIYERLRPLEASKGNWGRG